MKINNFTMIKAKANKERTAMRKSSRERNGKKKTMTAAMEEKTTMTIISKWTSKKTMRIDQSILCLFCILGILT